jgi:hypothetical protein
MSRRLISSHARRSSCRPAPLRGTRNRTGPHARQSCVWPSLTESDQGEHKNNYETKIHASRLYPNLDTLLTKGVIERARSTAAPTPTASRVVVAASSRFDGNGRLRTSTDAPRSLCRVSSADGNGLSTVFRREGGHRGHSNGLISSRTTANRLIEIDAGSIDRGSLSHPAGPMEA